METCEYILRPLSSFGTPLKGDTLFGQFCWQALHHPELLDAPLEGCAARYPESPFAIFSSAFPVFTQKRSPDAEQYAFRTPDLPPPMLFAPPEIGCGACPKQNKARKGKEWLPVARSDDGLMPSLKAGALDPGEDLLTDRGLAREMAPQKAPNPAFARTFSQPHNTINRLTNTTGTDAFAPFSLEVFSFIPGARFAIFVLFDPDFTDAERIRQGLEGIGKQGFGRDASTGMGRYEVVEMRTLRMEPPEETDAVYVLGPSWYDRERDGVTEAWFSPFTRFGRHGDWAGASGKPFKKPVIMAHEGAVLRVKDPAAVLQKGYVGRGVTNVSVTIPQTVVQGYAPVLPIQIPATDVEC